MAAPARLARLPGENGNCTVANCPGRSEIEPPLPDRTKAAFFRVTSWSFFAKKSSGAVHASGLSPALRPGTEAEPVTTSIWATNIQSAPPTVGPRNHEPKYRAGPWTQRAYSAA